MSTIHANTTFTLDGTNNFTVGSDAFAWNSGWVESVDVWSGDVGNTYTVTVSLTGSDWGIGALRFTGDADISVVINDDAAGANRFMDFLLLGTSSSTVHLTNTGVSSIVAYNNGNNTITTGTEWVGSILLDNGNDIVNIGTGGADLVRVAHGNNTVTTSSEWVGAIIAYDGNDTVSIGAGGAGSVYVGGGINTVTTSSGWVDSIIGGFTGNDTVSVGSGGAGSVNVGGGTNSVATSTGWVGAIVGYTGTDVVTLGSGGAGSIALWEGNDTYNLAAFDSVIIDNSGVDTITSTISRSIAGHATIERLTLLNVATALGGTGNNLANVITGNNFANTLSGGIGNDNLNGGVGNDKLIGGAGIDTLTGGLNNDIFVFNAPLSALNRDVITDFNHIADTFHLENAVMTALGAGVHALSATMFRAGAVALDASDHVIYNQATGYLSYDSNGNAAGGATLLAVLTNRPVLAANDFLVI